MNLASDSLLLNALMNSMSGQSNKSPKGNDPTKWFWIGIGIAVVIILLTHKKQICLKLIDFLERFGI